MPPTRVLIAAWTLTLGTPLVLAQELPGPLAAEESSADPVAGPTTAVTPVAEPEGSDPNSLAGPTVSVLPRAEVSPDRALAAGAGADTTQSDNRLPFQLGLTLAGYYDNNIYVQPGGGRVGDFIYDVVPFISWNSARETGVDNSIQITYAPGFVIYQDHPGNDTFEQTGSFVYGLHGAKSDLVVTQQYASVQNSAPDVGDLVKLDEYLTTINFDYALSARLGLTLRAEQQIIDYDNGLDSNQWTGSAYLGYELMPKTTIAVGSLVGVADLQGPNQDFVQINGRVIYNPTEKISVNATAGVEFRQTEGYASTATTPVFSGGLSYVPWDDTTLTAAVYREYNYSAKFFGEDYLATGGSFSVTQAFFHKVYATLSGSYENAQYENNLDDESSDQGYNYFSARAALDYQLKDWCDLGAYYQFRESISHSIGGFTDDQVGIQSRFNY